MKSPRFLAALAMAAVLTTGTTTAHAAFQQVGGTPVNGQTPMQQTEVKDTSNNPLTQALTSEGDISVNGEFKKTVNNFPTPTQDGHYLRVTMPIKMDFTYDVDTHTMTSAEGVVTNNSVYATNTGQAPTTQPNLEYKKVKMTLVDFVDNTTGTTTMTPDVEFVENVNASGNRTDAVLLPFELRVESSTGVVNDYSIKNIKSKASNSSNGIGSIEIAPNSTLKLKIDKIQGQNIGNENLITNQTSLTSHSLKLKFEYDGK